jgi:hypothetical protein
MAQDRAGELGEEALDEVEPGLSKLVDLARVDLSTFKSKIESSLISYAPSAFLYGRDNKCANSL